jgi:hypothetical protein
MNRDQIHMNARDIAAPALRAPRPYHAARPGTAESKARLRQQELRDRRAIAAHEKRRHNQNALTAELFFFACLVMTGVALLLSLWIGGSFFPARAYLF